MAVAFLDRLLYIWLGIYNVLDAMTKTMVGECKLRRYFISKSSQGINDYFEKSYIFPAYFNCEMRTIPTDLSLMACLCTYTSLGMTKSWLGCVNTLFYLYSKKKIEKWACLEWVFQYSAKTLCILQTEHPFLNFLLNYHCICNPSVHWSGVGQKKAAASVEHVRKVMFHERHI